MANPFKDLKTVEKELDNFLHRHRSSLYNHSRRISDFFEMSCYNQIVRFYENNGYVVVIKNLKKNKFRYKCSTAGNPDNFSFFTITLNQKNSSKIFEIRHNLNIQSSHQKDIFTTPDISVIKPKKIKSNPNFYNSNTQYYYVNNKDLITFCEVKNFNPFPELIFNFIGVVNELKPDFLRRRRNGRNHISTSLLISGKSNSHADRIKQSLEKRYHLNIFFDLFNLGGVTFSKSARQRIKKL